MVLPVSTTGRRTRRGTLDLWRTTRKDPYTPEDPRSGPKVPPLVRKGLKRVVTESHRLGLGVTDTVDTFGVTLVPLVVTGEGSPPQVRSLRVSRRDVALYGGSHRRRTNSYREEIYRINFTVGKSTHRLSLY